MGESSCDDILWNDNLNRISDFEGVLGVNYLHWFACGETPGSIVLLSMMLLSICCFYLLASTAENYFSPTLGVISHQLNIPHHVAGVTFVAFGNGSVDVFASFAAFSQGTPSPGLGLGALLVQSGAAMFLLTIVFGSVVLATKEAIVVQPLPFMRDSLFFLFTVIIITIKGLSGSAHTLGSSFGLILIYVLYVLVVMFVHLRAMNMEIFSDSTEENTRINEFLSSWDLDEASEDLNNEMQSYIPLFDTADSGNNSHDRIAEANTTPDVIENHIVPQTSDGWFSSFSDTFQTTKVDSDDSTNELNDENEVQISAALQRNSSHSNLKKSKSVIDDFYWRNLMLRRHAVQRFKVNYNNLKDQSIQQNLLDILEIPFHALRILTIPTIDPDDWSKYLVSIHPPCCTVLFIWAFKIQLIPSFAAMICIFSLIASVLAFFTLHVSRPPKDFRYKFGLIMMAFSCSIAWIYALATELVSLLSSFGVIFNLNQQILGLTILAWGNSCGDYVSNRALAKKGFPKMALAACFGGPLLNILLGLGGSLFILCLREDSKSTNLEFDNVALLTSITLIFILSGTLGFVVLRRFVLTNEIVIPLFVLYAFYLVLLPFV